MEKERSIERMKRFLDSGVIKMNDVFGFMHVGVNKSEVESLISKQQKLAPPVRRDKKKT